VVAKKLPEIFFLDQAPSDWLPGLQEQASGNWKTLRRWLACGRLFAVDAWDKYHHQVAVRIANADVWEEEADPIEARKALWLGSRGGTIEVTCIWVGCNKPRCSGSSVLP
jgi:hypothetical protein